MRLMEENTEEYRALADVRGLAEAVTREHRAAGDLQGVQVQYNPYSACSGEKREALEKYLALQRLEREQLDEEERQRLANIEQLTVRRDKEIAVT